MLTLLTLIAIVPLLALHSHGNNFSVAWIGSSFRASGHLIFRGGALCGLGCTVKVCEPRVSGLVLARGLAPEQTTTCGRDIGVCIWHFDLPEFSSGLLAGMQIYNSCTCQVLREGDLRKTSRRRLQTPQHKFRYRCAISLTKGVFLNRQATLT